MKKESLSKLFAFTFVTLLPAIAFARGGGGGSSGGGGGGGGFSGGGSFSGSHSTNGSNDSCTSFWSCFILFAIFAIFFVVTIVLIVRKQQKERLKKEAEIASKLKAAEDKDSIWNKQKLQKFASETFLEFQRAWSEMDTNALSKILEQEMHKRIALELSVLNNEKRKNITKITKLYDVFIISVNDNIDNNLDRFSVVYTAQADDRLLETDTEKVIFYDNSVFKETWDFVRSDDTWKLSAIHQATEDSRSLIPEISSFAQKNNFFYNPDFGWLMLPNKGHLFKESRFGNTDINNHVIGYYRDKIVEFYTMSIRRSQNNFDNYLVVQAILPISYIDILIRRKHLFTFAPSNMRKHEMESNDFIKEFEVYSDENDNISTFELLTPNFMEKIMGLPFEITMEVVGNTLYISTKENYVDYESMLQIISYAFDEMKM